jgi:hypothetical protein
MLGEEDSQKQLCAEMVNGELRRASVWGNLELVRQKIKHPGAN